MNLEETMSVLESYGSEQSKKILSRHGAKEPFFGVKVGDLKRILKKTGKDHELALQLYDTGNSDAMYLAGLMADEKRLTKTVLRKWVRKAYWYMLSQYIVAQLTAETKHGWSLGLEWIDSKKENIASAGWSTLSNIISITPDESLDLKQIEALICRIENTIHDGMNREKYAMSGFIICVGSYIIDLHDNAIKAAKRIGEIDVKTATPGCTAPEILVDIEKVKAKDRLGKKRKRARC
ncbi:DNA alkylation repair protein [Puniceicoccaceae bacterium K14]|nr:DNA alkylation repair protein [Puniceicoccaceae bacterium K14]